MEKYECLTCGKKFKVGDWLCEDGVTNHVVAVKEYLRDDAPSDPGHVAGTGMNSQRDGTTTICNIPPDKRVMQDGESVLVPGGSIVMVRGRYSTSDPEKQYWLEKTHGKTFCDEQRWMAAWLSDNQRMELREMNIRARENRVLQEENSLLNMVKQQADEPKRRGRPPLNREEVPA